MRSVLWKSDRFIGLLVVVIVYLFSGSDFVRQFDTAAFDVGVKFSSPRLASPDVVVVAIDDTSLIYYYFYRHLLPKHEYKSIHYSMENSYLHVF